MADEGQEEPSMEEILSSIRKILSEGEEAYSGEEGVNPEPNLSEAEPSSDVTDITDSDLTSVQAGDDDHPPEREGPQERVGKKLPDAAINLDDTAYGHKGLVEDKVELASRSHIAQLAQAVAQDRALATGDQGITIEQLVREICKPVLKTWLDENLPGVVERIVREEIERIVTRSRKP